jgi:two-component system response regulator AtoC
LVRALVSNQILGENRRREVSYMEDAELKQVVETEEQTQLRAKTSAGPVAVAQSPAAPAPWAALRSLRAATEIHAISRALEESGWNRKRAAKLLSISYRGLLYKIRQYNITPAVRSDVAQGSRPEI